jgi:hypothetical protein
VIAARVLMAASAGIGLLLGVMHLLYTFRGPKMTPRDPALRAHMERVSPIITRETTMWRAWIGFNASHSMGLLLFGLVYGDLSIGHPALLFRSPFLLAVGLAMLLGYLALARLYWFSRPFVAVIVALACYVAGVVASRL